MRKLAIYHAPQECGDPFLMFVNLENGQILENETINFDKGSYWDSGCELIECFKHTGVTRTTKGSSSRIPEVGDSGYYGRNCWVSTNVEITAQRELLGRLCYEYVITWEKQIRYFERKYTASEDEFKQNLINQGIDMTGWCVYKRRKTDFKDFIRAIVPDDVVNVIFI